MTILKPTKPIGLISIQIKIPASQAERLQNVRQGAAKAGLTLGLDQPLSKALARLLRTAEAELDKLSTAQGSSLQGEPAGIAAVDNLPAAAAPSQPFSCKENGNG